MTCTSDFNRHLPTAPREDSELQMRDLIRRRLPGGRACL